MTTPAVTVVGNGRIVSSFCEWEIDNYSSYSNLETGKCICSPTFDAQCNFWHLELYPNGEKKEYQGNISLFLYSIKSRPVGGIQARFSFTCLDSEKKVLATYDTKKMMTFSDISAWGRSKFVNNTSINNPDRIENFGEFKNFRNNSKFSDVKLTVESKEIFAHKAVLAANSSVFAAMFEHKMRENEENTVSIQDISYKVFNELLNFMYTGECAVMGDIVSDLFEAADKYQLLKLKSMCEEELCKNINVNNVVARLQLADMHSAQQLKKEAINFIVLRGKEIIDQPQFKSVGNLNTELLLDVFRGVFASK